MLLANILQTLDQEIERLYKLRAILVPLQQPIATLAAPDPEPEPSPVQAAAEPTLIRLPPKRAPRHRGPRARPAPDAPRALSGNIPSAPVVVPRAIALPQPLPLLPEPAAAVQLGSFAAMVRAAERQLGT